LDVDKIPVGSDSPTWNGEPPVEELNQLSVEAPPAGVAVIVVLPEPQIILPIVMFVGTGKLVHVITDTPRVACADNLDLAVTVAEPDLILSKQGLPSRCH
jgi:hypothetical protein